MACNGHLSLNAGFLGNFASYLGRGMMLLGKEQESCEKFTDRLHSDVPVGGLAQGDASSEASSNKRLEDVERENKSLRLELARESVAIAKLRKRLLEVTGNIHFYKSGSEYVVFKRNDQDVTLQNLESDI